MRINPYGQGTLRASIKCTFLWAATMALRSIGNAPHSGRRGSSRLVNAMAKETC